MPLSQGLTATTIRPFMACMRAVIPMLAVVLPVILSWPADGVAQSSVRPPEYAPTVAPPDLAIPVKPSGTAPGSEKWREMRHGAESSVRPPENATTVAPPDLAIPGKPLGSASDADIWREIRHGASGTVSIVDKRAATMIRSAGEDWRLLRNGPLFFWLGYAILGTLVLLAAFFAFRGRIRVEHGLSGKTITRFSGFERMGHWLMAVSFVILGLSGLNMTFGRDFLLPLIGKEAFGPFAGFLKVTHDYVAFAFMLGLAIAFVVWVAQNIPNRHDLVWISKAGGMFSKGVHPPARKFNAGQKVVFWGTMIGGLSLCLSGWALLFPFEHSFFTDTFQTLGAIGIDIPALIGLPPAPYSALQEQQFNSVWHGIVAILMICMILAHIYIGTIGMEGAFDAMGTGEVDLNWAKEHHSVWVEEVAADGGAAARPGMSEGAPRA